MNSDSLLNSAAASNFAAAPLPLIIGHRGASSVAPENTLAAFERALDDGADGVEFDVRLARDGVPVVIHDATLERTGLLRGVAVSELSSSELGEVDAGTWFNLRFPEAAWESYARERIPTLARTFELIGARSRFVYVEMKCEDGDDYAPLAAAVVGLIREHELVGRAVVKCFAHEAIREVKRLAPEIRTAALFDRKLSRPFVTTRRIIAQALACGADEISLHRSLVRRRVVEAARGHGVETLVWTVDTPSWVGRARRLGLRAIFTNRPAEMLGALDSLRTSI
ncbi:MAG TPA: glycerophosphodiester phosphodiesterase family protein [Pyrinomonadaceae bacterium]|jgi:glycerophosphoryl diester phosphodiesterase|nr:glycerophosphodiester phosphodiesterase family protein [Pyrinomonadaceae bacterium]